MENTEKIYIESIDKRRKIAHDIADEGVTGSQGLSVRCQSLRFVSKTDQVMS